MCINCFELENKTTPDQEQYYVFPQKIGSYEGYGPSRLFVDLASKSGKHNQEKVHRVSFPAQLYVNPHTLPEAERSNRPLRVMVLMAGYGGVMPDRYFRELITSLDGSINAPDIITIASMPGYHPDRATTEALRADPSLAHPEQFPDVVKEVVRHTLGVATLLSPQPLVLIVAVHSAAMWGLPEVRSSKGFTTPDKLSELYAEYKENGRDIKARYAALAPCGEQTFPLGLASNVFHALYRTFASGLPPNGTWAMDLLRWLLTVVGYGEEGGRRVELWARHADPIVIVTSPQAIHMQGTPYPSQDTLNLIVYGDAIAKKGKNDLTAYIGGSHSHPDNQYISALLCSIHSN